MPLLLLAHLACTPDPVERTDIRYLMAGTAWGPEYSTGDTADTGAPPGPFSPLVVVSIGQSNNCAMNAKPAGWPYSLTGNHAGVTLIRFGVLRANYTGPVSPDAYLIDELIAVGYDPEDIVLVARCAQNVPIANLITVQMPAIEADLAAFNLPTPKYLFVWQGEREALEPAGDNDGALLYADDLYGPRGTYSLRTAVEEAGWTATNWSLVELAVRSTEYVDPSSAALVRSAQYGAAAYYPPGHSARICVIPTFGATFLPGNVTPNDNPHADLASVEAIARRAVHGFFDPECP